MHEKAVIGVRYCGGCNPRYDRVQVIKKLAALVPEADFVTAQAGVGYNAVIVVSGCPSQCAKVDDLAVMRDNLLRLNGWEDLLPLKKTILEKLQNKEEQSLDHDQVLEILPHRPPMLFIDTVERLVPGKEIGAKFRLDPSMPVFAGHFPGNPVFPGVLTLEAMAQAADIMMMTVDSYKGKTPLLTGINKMRQRRMLEPGTEVSLHASLAEERRELGWIVCRCQAVVGEETAAEAEIILVMR
ncbi:MAG: 3-hydroxyacyl-ACP dehydratase FabZ [Lachnospiraceae bacterium]|nr:3-hydroxyacyl-ACP dehydratase FabZ [Lachnospiraceae bacterium]